MEKRGAPVYGWCNNIRRELQKIRKAAPSVHLDLVTSFVFQEVMVGFVFFTVAG